MLQVRATERSKGQTESFSEMLRKCGVGRHTDLRQTILSLLERSTKEGDSPVKEIWKDLDESESSAYWILSMNMGDSNFQP